MLIGNLGFHLNLFLVKLCYFTSDISVWQVTTERALIVVCLCTLTICIKHKSLFYVPSHLRWLLFARCFFGTTSFTLLFISLKYVTYSTSILLSSLYPIFTAVGAWLLMNEKLTIFDILALFLSLTGVTFFAFPQIFGDKPTQEQYSQGAQYNTSGGIVMAFLQPIFMSITVLALRKIGNRIHSLTSPTYLQLFAFSLSLFPFCGIGFTQGYKTHYTWEIVLYLILGGSFEYLALVAMAAALQLEKAGRVVNLVFAQIVISFLIDIFIFKAQISLSQILGSVLITTSCLMIAILKCTGKIK